MIISTKYDFGDTVYLITDDDQKERMISGFRVLPGGVVVYMLSCGANNSEHFDFEITAEKNLVK